MHHDVYEQVGQCVLGEDDSIYPEQRKQISYTNKCIYQHLKLQFEGMVGGILTAAGVFRLSAHRTLPRGTCKLIKCRNLKCVS